MARPKSNRRFATTAKKTTSTRGRKSPQADVAKEKIAEAHCLMGLYRV